MKNSKPAGISEKVIRLLDIYTMIAQKHFPSVPPLKEHFGISERSVYRYLEIIKMIDGIEYDQALLPSSLLSRLQSHRKDMADHEDRSLCKHPLPEQSSSDRES
jgi:hypothetical protein